MKIKIGQYNLLSLLGTGGMSEVYLAQNIKTGTNVAIKILDKKLSRDEEYIKRFQREIEISKTLNHHNVVKIISYGKDGEIKILDFGIARATTKSTITNTGIFMGSPHYASPEQVEGKKIDKKTDILMLKVYWINLEMDVIFLLMKIMLT